MEDLTHVHPGTREHSSVPEGVDPQSWLGFERQIRERRFRALLNCARAGVTGGDIVAAHTALDEARELWPDAPEVAELERQLRARSLTARPTYDRLSWSRAAGALLLLFVGVAMNMGVELLRPAQRTTIVPPRAVPAPTPPPMIEPARPRDFQEENAPQLSAPVPTLVTNVVLPSREAEQLPFTRRETPRALTAPVAPPRRSSIAAERGSSVRETPEHTVAPRPAPGVAARSPLTLPADDAPAAATPPPARTTVNRPPTALTPPAAAIPTPAVVATTTAAADESRVADVLRRYARAYGELNARAARDVWPSVDERALARAFENLASQRVSFDDCRIDVRGTTANASCRGQASYVGKVGGGEPRTEPRTWQFELQREGDDWKIKNAEARRLTTSSQ